MSILRRSLLAVDPFRPVEARELLDRPVDRLDDLGAMNNDAASSVRKLVLSLFLAVTRVAIDGGLEQGSLGEPEQVEPEPLDLALPL
jgi:hypothetical protein